MQIPPLPIHTDPLPDPVNDSEQVYADNVYSLILYFANQFVPGYNVSMLELNTLIAVLNNQLAYSRYRGDYLAPAVYDVGESVTFEGSIWYSKVANNTGNTPVDGANWTKPAGIVAAILATARLINGVPFDGSADINIEDRLGVAIASAATTTVGTVGIGDYIHITGTTTITSLGTAASAGVRRTLIFDGALTLTHNATSLICPGAANIVTVAGTVIEVIAETTANWRVVSITHPAISFADVASILTKLNLSGGVMTGAITSLRETKVAMPANAIDLAAGNLFTKTITVATTFTLSNIPTTGQAAHFILELTNGGAFTITWFSGVKWANGIAPILTAAGVDILGFYSHDGGTTWRGIVMAKDSK